MIIFLFVLEERDPSYILYWEYRGQITDIQINPSGRRILQLINNSIWILLFIPLSKPSLGTYSYGLLLR